MTGAVDPAVLSGLALYRGLSPEQLEKLAPLLHQRTLPAGANVITAEEPGGGAYVILSGSAKVYVAHTDGSEVILTVLGPGEVVGEMSVADSLGRSASVLTLEDSTFLWMDRRTFLWSMEEMPQVAPNLVGILSRRLRLADTHTRSLAALDVHGRVAGSTGSRLRPRVRGASARRRRTHTTAPHPVRPRRPRGRLQGEGEPGARLLQITGQHLDGQGPAHRRPRRGGPREPRPLETRGCRAFNTRGVKRLIAPLHAPRYTGVRKGKAAENERREAMTKGHEVKANHEEVEAFVGKLKDFHGSLDEGERAMLGTILEGAQQGETGGFGFRRWSRYQDPTEGEGGSESSSGWNDLIGWIEEQGEEDTQGFAIRGK